MEGFRKVSGEGFERGRNWRSDAGGIRHLLASFRRVSSSLPLSDRRQAAVESSGPVALRLCRKDPDEAGDLFILFPIYLFYFFFLTKQKDWGGINVSVAAPKFFSI